VTKRTPLPANYDSWIVNKRNVLFTGKHGIGKTETVKEKFDEHYGKGNWLYFSASTLDPWVDFVGVPKEVFDPITHESYLDLVRPKLFQTDSVRAIMIDEYNRAAPKVRNAVMEILQFKSINGKKMENLEVIWAAINPDDDDSYDVEKLDPAQRDRFHVHVELPYAVNREFFTKRYGAIGNTACDWWDALEDDVKDEISPRRLSYVLDEYLVGGDLSYILPASVSVHQLVTQLADGAPAEKLKALFLEKNDAASKEAFESENFYFATEALILNDKSYQTYFVQHFPKEKLIKTFLSHSTIRRHIMDTEDYRKYQIYFDPIISQKSGGTNKIEYSIISGLKRWRAKTIPSDELSDMEFINVVSDNRHNIGYYADPDKQREVINRVGLITSYDIILAEDYYTKMFGVMCELLTRTEEALHPFILANIRTIKKIRERLHYVKLDIIYTQKLAGLRKIAQSDTLFNEVGQRLIQEKIINEITQ
jgi:hypothetical protein